MGHEVHFAADGTGALAQACSRLPDVVLLDIGLPDLDGYEVARRLRATPGPKPRFIIALSGQECDEGRRQAAGIDLYLAKPVEPEDLRRVLGPFGRVTTDALTELGDGAPPCAGRRPSPTSDRPQLLQTGPITSRGRAVTPLAMSAFSQSPGPTLAWFGQHLPPIPKADNEQLAQLLKQLDDDRFGVRNDEDNAAVVQGLQEEGVGGLAVNDHGDRPDRLRGRASRGLAMAGPAGVDGGGPGPNALGGTGPVSVMRPP
jgi:CheY-like chemotaxis protein